MRQFPLRRRPLTVERLEDRTQPAGLSLSLMNGILSIAGTPQDDTIVVRQVGNRIQVDGVASVVKTVRVSRIHVDAGAGNDTILLNSQDTTGQDPLTAPGYVNGGDGHDKIVAAARGGNYYGQGGDDSIYGSTSPDYLVGGDGVDRIDGGAGNDFISGQGGNDHLIGGDGNDTVYGDAGNDTMNGGAGDDRLFGDAGNDSLYGSSGNDALDGGANDDYLEAASGNDNLVGGSGRDAFNGGDGYDTFRDDYTAPPAGASPEAVARSLAVKEAGEDRYALPDDIRQQIADTCSLLASLATFARSPGTDLAQRVRYDSSSSQYLVPLFVNNAWSEVGVSFNGTWTDNEPYANLADTGGMRDYWPTVYQRAYLKAMNVDTSAENAKDWAVQGTTASQLTAQRWRYPDVALRAVTGQPVVTGKYPTDADLAPIETALGAGRHIIANTHTVEANRPKVEGTGLVFSHTYTVESIGRDAQGVFLTLRNPWGTDSKPERLAQLSAAERAFFTAGDENDGVVRVRWDTFKQAFSTYVYSTTV